jgi:hypothetical protein
MMMRIHHALRIEAEEVPNVTAAAFSPWSLSSLQASQPEASPDICHTSQTTADTDP